MKPKVKITIDPLTGEGIDEAIRAVAEYKRWIEEKTNLLAKRLAEIGYDCSYQVLSGHIYSGDTLSSLTVEEVGPAQFLVKAESEAILFLEFGAGLIGYGHPEPQGYGPGTYPGKGHWDDPNGWWYETDDPALAVKTSKKTGKMYGHSRGTPAYMPMYGAVRELEQRFKQIVAEVFI